MLDLENCFRLKVIPPRIISSLTRLEELNMENSFTNWEEVEGSNTQRCNSSLGELKELPNLKCLYIQIPDVQTSWADIFLFFQNLQRFKIEIGMNDLFIGEYKYSQRLTLEFFSSTQLENWTRMLPEKVEYLSLKQVNGVKKVFHDFSAKGFSHLKFLSISHNDEIECIINSMSSNHVNHGFPNLEELRLRCLNNLEHICYGPVTEGTFCKLRTIQVYGCEKLQNMFTFSMVGLGVLRQLVDMSISECKSMKEIVMLETEENLDLGLGVEFTELRFLEMDDLPELISFCSTKTTSSTSEADKSNPSLPLFSNKESFPKLEDLYLSRINMKQIWDDKFSKSACFPNMTRLRIEGCDRIEDMSPLAKGLVNLKHFELRACSMVEELIITKESCCEKILFSNLESLTISHMDNMRTMWDRQISPDSFSNVKQIEVSYCAKLVSILPVNVGKNFQNLDTLKVCNCSSLEMIFNLQELNDAKAHARGIHCHLKYLTLKRLPKLMHIWNGDLKGIPIIFQDLQEIEVESCENLNYIFPVSIGKCFMQLEKLKIVSCGVTEIVAEDTDGSNEVIGFLFPKVKHVSLMWLPKLTSFHPGLMHTLEWPMLNELHVSNQNEVKIFSLQEVPNFQRDALEMQLSSGRKLFFSPKKEIVPNLESLYLEGNSAMILYLNGQFQVLFHSIKILGVRDCSSLRSLVPATYSSTPFQNVHTLEIESCDGLINLIALSTAKSALARLQKLSIEYCEKIEEIISSDHHGQDVEVDEIVFPQLKCLKLNVLPNLKSFYPEKCTLQFPSLEEVFVIACPNMEMFTPGVVLAPLLNEVKQDKYWFARTKFRHLWKGDLNSTISQMFTNMHEEMPKGFPKSIKHPLHEKHELVVAWGSHNCNGCREGGDNWSYFCGRCHFDLHPTRALEGRNKAINEAVNR